MKTSEQINELAEALSKAQEEIEVAKKGTVNPFFKKKYSDLPSVVKASRKALVKNNLSIVQGGEKKDGEWILNTRIIHKSGQWIEGDFPIIVKKEHDPQALGSSITYAKRYGLAALVGVVSDDEDDDGNKGANKDEDEKPPMFDEDESLPDFPPVDVTSFGSKKFPLGEYKDKTFEEVVNDTPVKAKKFYDWVRTNQKSNSEKIKPYHLDFAKYYEVMGKI